MFTVPVLDINGKEVEKIKLDAKIFDGSVNSSALHRAAVGYLAGKRRGLASTRTRGEVSGGGKKPWRQKGTGRARVGSIRSPLWRGGGIIFGPHPRDFALDTPKQVKLLALRSSLNGKLNDNGLVLVDEIKLPSQKTGDFFKLLKKLKVEGKALFIISAADKDNARAAANISGINIRRVSDVNAYDIMNCKKVLTSSGSFKELLKRLR
ncbi:MAG: 50S ribosomal protein L4 [Candidatus Omnitrophica bacterium]|nr:50S ribosomal protein L4 [Candidatus Omnitrophota bacterium]